MMPVETLGGLDFNTIGDTPDRFFTKYGFAYPLSLCELDFAAALDGQLPPAPKGRWKNTTAHTKYALIDKHGRMWQYTIYNHDGEDQYEMYNVPMPAGSSIVMAHHEGERCFVKGMLIADASIEQLTNVGPLSGIDIGIKLTWFDWDDVIKRIKETAQ
jgi:hypothetical protein